MKHAAKSKTILFGLALIALDAIPQLQGLLAEVFPEFMGEYGVALVGVVTILLRFATNKPIKIRG